jgi:hypothetical protein
MKYPHFASYIILLHAKLFSREFCLQKLVTYVLSSRRPQFATTRQTATDEVTDSAVSEVTGQR